MHSRGSWKSLSRMEGCNKMEIGKYKCRVELRARVITSGGVEQHIGWRSCTQVAIQQEKEGESWDETEKEQTKWQLLIERGWGKGMEGLRWVTRSWKKGMLGNETSFKRKIQIWGSDIWIEIWQFCDNYFQKNVKVNIMCFIHLFWLNFV